MARCTAATRSCLWIFALSALVLGWSFGETSIQAGESSVGSDASTVLTQAEPAVDRMAVRDAAAPDKAYRLLERLQERKGLPLPGYVGGRDFQNRERRLPRGRYREYDVNRKIPGRSRDAERIVIEQKTGKAYYTGDHYRTFVPLN